MGVPERAHAAATFAGHALHPLVVIAPDSFSSMTMFRSRPGTAPGSSPSVIIRAMAEGLRIGPLLALIAFGA